MLDSQRGKSDNVCAAEDEQETRPEASELAVAAASRPMDSHEII